MSAVLDRMQRQATLLGGDRPTMSEVQELVEQEERRWKAIDRGLRRGGGPLASFITGTNTEVIYMSKAAGTAKNTFTAEVQINDTAGMGTQAMLPGKFWNTQHAERTGIKIIARGILSSTATPTYTFTVRLGAAGNTTAAIVLGSAAMTTGSGVSNAEWVFEGDVYMEALGAAGNNSTVRGKGSIECGGLASPFWYALNGGAASPGTVATVDWNIDNYINFNVACSASSASNTITLQQLTVYGLN